MIQLFHLRIMQDSMTPGKDVQNQSDKTLPHFKCGGTYLGTNEWKRAACPFQSSNAALAVIWK